jgi:hypothetical protein
MKSGKAHKLSSGQYKLTLQRGTERDEKEAPGASGLR